MVEIKIEDAKDTFNKQINNLLEVIALLAKKDIENITKDVENLEKVIKQHYEHK
jgi:hypothetical protein